MMLRQTLLGTTVLSATALLATTASADITGGDVWDMYTKYYEATGATVIGEPEANGDTTVITNPALLYRLPFSIATIRVGLPDITLTDQSDGTVALSFPDVVEMPIEIDVPDELTVSATLVTTPTGYAGVASGTPGNVTFAQSATAMKVELKDLVLPDEGAGVDMALLVQSDGFDVTSQVTDGDLITVASDLNLGGGQVAYIINGDDGVVISNTGTFGPSINTSQMALPAGGSNVFNLGAALQAGAYVRGTVQAEGNESETITTVGNDVISEQATMSGPTEGTYAIDANGFAMDVAAAFSTFRVTMPDAFPFPVEGGMGEVAMKVLLPLLPSDAPQDVALKFGVADLEIDDVLWDLFDPEMTLPRDPATMNIDLSGSVISGIDWLNIATLEGQLDQPVPPITAERVDINDVTVSAVGAAVNGSGGFTLDMTDLESFDGFPRPEGAAQFTVEGANALIDNLITLGVIGSDEAGMARLGMGFIARSIGADAFETAVEVNAEGHVLVNGQRMR